MNISQETQIKVSDLYAEYAKQAKQEIAKEAKKNFKYKVGDIVKKKRHLGDDLIGKIKSIEIDIDLPHRRYYIVCTCERLTKALKPYKSGQEFFEGQSYLSLYQS